MVKRAPKKKKQGSGTKAGTKRRERRFSTSATFLPLWVGVVGIAGCLLLGMGVFGTWILDPAPSYASYLVAAGGFGLGVALWFSQPKESAVFVGDAGIAIDDGRQTLRVAWYAMRSLRIENGFVLVEGPGHSLKFLLGANQKATAHALREAALRVPDVVDADKNIMETLPEPSDNEEQLKGVEDDQVTGSRCATSNKLISMEEDARICPRCGQVFHKESVPEACPSCEAALKGKTLLA